MASHLRDTTVAIGSGNHRMTDAETRFLDDPVWAALTTSHRALAQGGPLAWRYPSDVSPFAAIADRSRASFVALAALVPPGGQVALSTLGRLVAPAGFAVEMQAPIIQMILDAPAACLPSTPEHVVLGPDDVAEMLDLTGRTRPGPFGPRTIELGHYIGLRAGGALVAMAGERMRFGRFVEISAVCVDPAHRGKGYAALLMTRLALRQQADGSVPILHSFATNAQANSLYERLGYTTRRTLVMTVLRAAVEE